MWYGMSPNSSFISKSGCGYYNCLHWDNRSVNGNSKYAWKATLSVKKSSNNSEVVLSVMYN